ncbi:MAG: hypothetical protein IJ809_00555 [Clostridia bacterium]|nr:hypothetical protein [Clostridia bacterium]
MASKSRKTIFKEMRWAYLVFAIIAVIFGIIIIAIPSVIETVNKTLPNLSQSLGGVDLKTYFIVSLSISVLFDIWYAYLISRCADGKSKGTLLLILLILGVVSGIVTMLTTKSFYDARLVIDAVTLLFLIRYKTANKE